MRLASMLILMLVMVTGVQAQATATPTSTVTETPTVTPTWTGTPGIFAGSVRTARDCGNGFPCGPLPIRYPILPTLATSTPLATVSFPSPTSSSVVPPPAPDASWSFNTTDWLINHRYNASSNCVLTNCDFDSNFTGWDVSTLTATFPTLSSASVTNQMTQSLAVTRGQRISTSWSWTASAGLPRIVTFGSLYLTDIDSTSASGSHTSIIQTSGTMTYRNRSSPPAAATWQPDYIRVVRAGESDGMYSVAPAISGGAWTNASGTATIYTISSFNGMSEFAVYLRARPDTSTGCVSGNLFTKGEFYLRANGDCSLTAVADYTGTDATCTTGAVMLPGAFRDVVMSLRGGEMFVTVAGEIADCESSTPGSGSRVSSTSALTVNNGLTLWSYDELALWTSALQDAQMRGTSSSQTSNDGSVIVASTPTPAFDIEPLLSPIETLQARLDATSPVLVNEEGTPIAFADQIQTAVPAMDVVFAYAKGANSGFLGPFSAVFDALLFGVLIIMLVTLATFALPLIGTLLGLMRKLWDALPFS